MNNEINFGKPTEKQRNEFFHLFGTSIPADINNNQAGNIIGEERKRRSDEARNSFAKWCGQNKELISEALGDISKKDAENAYRYFGQEIKEKRKLVFGYTNN